MDEKFCKFCGEKIVADAVLCPKCGRQVEELKSATAQPSIVINNSNSNVNGMQGGYPGVKMKNKWVSFLLCLFLDCLGAHRFYEGKIGTGILWLLTGGLFGIGVLVDLICILFKPNPYYV